MLAAGRPRRRRPGRCSGSGPCGGSCGRSLGGAVGEGAVGEQEDGVGARARARARRGGGRSRLGVDQVGASAKVWDLAAGSADCGQAAGHRQRPVVVEDHLEALREPQRRHAPAQLALRAEQPARRRPCCPSNRRRRRRPAPGPDAEERGLPPGGTAPQSIAGAVRIGAGGLEQVGGGPRVTFGRSSARSFAGASAGTKARPDPETWSHVARTMRPRRAIRPNSARPGNRPPFATRPGPGA